MRLVRKRCFMQMFGYEAPGIEQQHRRFVREMARFEKSWGVSGEVSPPRLAEDGLVANWGVVTRGPNWQVETDYHYLRWEDIVAADQTVGDGRRILSGIAALGEFVLTGTAWRYLDLAWRYGVFFLFPILALLVMALVSGLVASVIVGGFGLPLPWLIGPLVALGVFALLWWRARSRLFLRFVLDDWCFARDLIHEKRPDVDRRLDRFAEELVRLVRESDADEFVIDGTSLGAPMTMLVVDRALKRDPALGQAGLRIHLVSSGSSLLKLALHPRAAWLRAAVGRVTAAPGVFWVDFQARDDFLNLYDVHPATALGLPDTGQPVIRLMRVQNMVEEEAYSRIRFNFYKMHRQPRSGNDRRYFYDYYMLCCGPVALADRVADPDGAVAAFAADGALRADMLEEGR